MWWTSVPLAHLHNSHIPFARSYAGRRFFFSKASSLRFRLFIPILLSSYQADGDRQFSSLEQSSIRNDIPRRGCSFDGLVLHTPERVFYERVVFRARNCQIDRGSTVWQFSSFCLQGFLTPCWNGNESQHKLYIFGINKLFRGVVWHIQRNTRQSNQPVSPALRICCISLAKNQSLSSSPQSFKRFCIYSLSSTLAPTL